MTYVTINEKTSEGRRILEELRKNRKTGKILDEPNEETKQALRHAKAGKGVKRIKDIDKWLEQMKAN